MDKKFENLGTVLRRVLEGKMDLGNGKAELRRVFDEFCKMIDVDGKNLRGAENCYYFTKAESDYLESFFKGMSESPLRELRKGKFDEVPSAEYEKLEAFLDGCMRNAGKDDACIQEQMLAFRHRTGWIYRRDTKAILADVDGRLNDLFGQVSRTVSFNVNNRLDILAAIRYSLGKQLTAFCDTWQAAIFEISEGLDEILIDNGIEMGKVASPVYWKAVKEAESRISGDGYFEKDEILRELEEQLSELENGTIKNAKEAAKKRQKIVGRKETIRQICMEKYGVSSEAMQEAESIGGQGHGRDDFVIQVIKKTLEDVLGVEDVTGWRRQDSASKAAADAAEEQIEDEGADTIEDVLRDFHAQLEAKGLTKWFS